MRFSIADFKKFSLGSLTKRQTDVLLGCDKAAGTATSFARSFSMEHGMPLSTVWHNMRILRGKGLLEFSNTVHLTQLGVIVARLAVAQQAGVQIPELGIKQIKEVFENGKKR